MSDASVLLNAASLCLAWLVLSGAASLAAAACYPLFARVVAADDPARRGLLLLGYGLMPPLLAGVAALLLMRPELVGPLLTDHCHGDFCGPHAPKLGGVRGTVLLTAASLGTFLLIALGGGAAWRRGRRGALLEQLSRPAGGWRIIPGEKPLAWCEGVWHPRVYLSSSLVHRLAEAELALVVAHEQAHVSRRDNLRRQSMHWATMAWPSRLRRRVMADLALAHEQACDGIAFKRLGMPPDAAARLLPRLERDDTVQARLAALEARPVPRWRTFAAAGLAWLIASILLDGLTRLGHPLLEWLAG
ncbi:MAG: M56 family metallopeptidase [Chromatiales bacterium]|nr:M56 family metallopeptidase [Chromatiales bacterium]